MTGRGWGSLLLGLALLAGGRIGGSAYAQVLGVAALTAVAMALILRGPTARASVSSSDTHRRVVRRQPSAISLVLRGANRTAPLRLADGDPHRPARTLVLPTPHPGPSVDGGTPMRLDLDTENRGEYPIGPFRILQGDPWSLLQSTIDEDPGGRLTVIPRVLRLRPDFRRRLGLDSPTRGNRRGEGQFHALRDYQLGDEPRLIHWRSSARAGKLIVRQDVAPTSVGSLVLLDLDASAYNVEGRLAGAFDSERFESAVEAAASIAVAQGRDLEVAHLATTETMTSIAMASAGMAEGVLDALAIVRPAPPTANAPERLQGLIQHLKVSRLIVVTGTPSPALIAAIELVSARIGTAVVRVGSTAPTRIARAAVLDITSVEEVS